MTKQDKVTARLKSFLAASRDEISDADMVDEADRISSLARRVSARQLRLDPESVVLPAPPIKSTVGRSDEEMLAPVRSNRR